MNWPPHRFHGKAEAPKVCVHCPLPESNPLHVKPADAEEAMLGPAYPFVAADDEHDPPQTPPFMYFRCYPCPGCGSEFRATHRPGCEREKPEDRMIDQTLAEQFPEGFTLPCGCKSEPGDFPAELVRDPTGLFRARCKICGKKLRIVLNPGGKKPGPSPRPYYSVGYGLAPNHEVTATWVNNVEKIEIRPVETSEKADERAVWSLKAGILIGALPALVLGMGIGVLIMLHR